HLYHLAFYLKTNTIATIAKYCFYLSLSVIRKTSKAVSSSVIRTSQYPPLNTPHKHLALSTPVTTTILFLIFLKSANSMATVFWSNSGQQILPLISMKREKISPTAPFFFNSSTCFLLKYPARTKVLLVVNKPTVMMAILIFL